MAIDPATRRSPLKFFGLLFALTAPFWLLSTVVKAEGLPDNLPVTDVGATFVPLFAAAILIYREEKLDGVKRLLRRTFDYRRIKNKAWYIPILVLMPSLYILTHWIMRLLGLPVPAGWDIPWATPFIFLAFFIAAAGEELGYMGYLIDPMQLRWTALATGLIVGSIWALWHFPSMIQLGQTPILMTWGFLATVAFRILYIWLYNNTNQSVFGVILFHAISNTGRTIFPGGRSHFELANATVGYSMIVVAAIVVVFLWGPKTLAHFNLRKSK